MANFVQGDASPIADIQPWTPDWSFLEQVYGVTQQRYDRGFNMVKSLYNSVLNSKVTNSQNAEFRNMMFQKLQGSLRNVAALDLSDPTNIAKAQDLLDPITEDKDLAYDMYATKHHDGQKAIMDRIKNSTDAKERGMYSDYSKMDIQFAEDDLRRAKRGDGSIQSVQMRDFTPFEDVNEYLNKAAKDSDLKIVNADAKGGYILTYTNGERAEKPFSEWAAAQLGNKFDRQFQVMGRVKAENEVRSLMQEKGITRDQAVGEVSQGLAGKYLDSQYSSLQDVESNLADVQSGINQYKKIYPNGIPADQRNLKAKYDKLIDAEKALTDSKTQLKDEISKLETDPQTYLGANLHGIYTNQAKKTAATSWGVTRADATSEVDIKPDQKVIADWDRAAANARAAADRELRWKVHQEEQALKKSQFEQKMEFDIMKAKNKGELQSETYVGSYLGTKAYGSEILSQSNAKNKSELFNNTFGAGNGLINLVIDKASDHGKYYGVMQKLNSIANGSGAQLNANDKVLLSAYAKKVGYYSSIPGNITSKTGAYAFLSTLTANTYNAANKQLGVLSKLSTAEAKKYTQTFQNTLTAMKRDLQEQREIDKSYRNVAGAIYNYDTKSIKAGYEGAKIIGKLPDGTPLFDLSNLSEAKRKQLDNLVGGEFKARSNSVGGVYTFTKPSSDELYSLFQTSNTIKVLSSDGERINSSILKNVNDAELKKLIGDQLQASFDPGSKKMIVKLKPGSTDALGKQLKLKAGTYLKVEIPYELIESSGALTRFKRYAKHNSIDIDSYGIMEAFSKNRFNTVEAPSYMEKTGFDFTATGVLHSDGRYGANITYTMLNPSTKKKQQFNKFVSMDQNDPSSFYNLSETINSIWTNYQMQTGNWEQQFSNSSLISY